MKLIIIGALDAAGGVGFKGRLPWKIPEDLLHFRQATMGWPIVMGWKTHLGFSQSLDGRLNIVHLIYPLERQVQVPGMLGMTTEEVLTRLSGFEKVFIIGGPRTWETFLPHSDEMILTHVPGIYVANAFFPIIEPNDWKSTLIKRLETRLGDMDVVRYTRKKSVHWK